MGSFFQGLSSLFPHLLDHTVEISVLICLIFLVKLVGSKKLPPWWHYSLWLLLLVRMLVPLEFENRLNIFNFVPTVRTHQVSELISVPSPENEIPAPPMMPKPHTMKAELRFAVTKSVPVIWLSGALVLGICIVFESLSFWRNIRKKAKVTDKTILALLSECKSRMKIRRNIDIVVTDNVRSPALFGYFRPRLLLPEGIFEKLSDRELSYAFMHELGHLKRHDIGVSWLVALLQVIHWFNPLVWLAFYQMRVDQESACDSAVLSRMNPKQSMDYAKAIVGFLEKFCHNCQLPALAGVLENRSQMKRRIAKIVQYRKTSLTVTFMAVILFVSAGFLLFTLTGVAAEKRRTSPGMEMASIEIPGHVSAVSTNDVAATPEGFHDGVSGMGNEMTAGSVSHQALQLEASPDRLQEGLMVSLQNETLRPVRGAPDQKTEDAAHAAEVVPERSRAVSTDASTAKSSNMTGTYQFTDPGPMGSEQPMTAGSNQPGAEGVGVVVASETGLTNPERSPVPVVFRGEPEQAFQVAGSGMGHERAGIAAPEESGSQLHSVDNFQARIEGHTALGYDLPENERKRPNSVAVSAAIDMMERDSGEMLRDFSSSTPMKAKQGGNGVAAAFRAEDVDTPPRLIKSYSPRYPYMAKRDDISGSIILQFVVTKEGDVVDTTVVQSDPKGVFDQAALRAIENYQFKPGTKDGEAVDVKVNLPIKFNLS